MKRIALVLIVMFVLTLAGCFAKVNNSEKNSPINPKPIVQDVSKEISLYFLNDKMNGLILERRLISKDADVLKQVVAEMIKGPTDEYAKPVFPNGTKLISIELQEGIAFVNFSKEFLQDSEDEGIDKLRVAALVNALTDIPGVESVQILVEGNKIDAVGKYKIGLDPLKRMILVGDVYNNPDRIKKLQERADLGKETWRFDPIQLLRQEGGIIGIGSEDELTLKNENNGVAYVEAIHNNKMYSITLIQPLGKGNNYIWVIDNVKAKFTEIPETNPAEGETFIYGIVKAIDYENRIITIEREYQDSQDMKNQVGPDIKVLPDAIIHFQAKVGYDSQGGFKYAEKDISFAEIKIGDELGIILTKDKEARAIIVSDRSNISYEPNIKVVSPVKNDVVTSPFKVIGKARVFEGNVNIRLVDSNGNILSETVVQATAGAPSWGDFEAIISYKALKEPQNGILQVFSLSPKDGSVQNLVSVPLKLK
ncbi:Spore germination protein-like protein [Thermoanaerobacter mathranii subsp. mathranii str. A3]|uniref:Spore germination protein-like protein n=1 Tax=Thermoanaerobacter mathranii subsp. mathranii (strain DSM 11426 / CCUG 53645 / CIP 108742 / A3) TaxID=583358 RepID=A0ABN3YZN5_THEM3|nr:Gmad2 immunoglobulin-like domain-containing protein [Thermoanaerobacter mathranii]ADH60302.1 Spore germination protein-like protein [Thermoanaerobacter mathranii subsp. mathranii str. A3]